MAEGSFQKQVAYVALVLFIILMALMALMMAKQKEHQLYPTEVPPCPDYWERMDDGQCNNIHGLGNSSNCMGKKPFSAKKWQGMKGRKEKCKFAKQCDIEWDGISNTGIC